MNAFFYGVTLQWKLDLRNKGVLLTYYVIPLIFFVFMGGIFSSINPQAKNSLIQTMTVFGITMGAILGASTPLVELYSSEIKKLYKVGNIPLWIPVINNLISAFIHLFIMSIVIFFAAPIVFNAKIPTNLVIYFISLAIFIFTSLLVGTALGLIIKNTSKVTMIGQLIFLPSIMLSGIMFPSDMLPKILQSVSIILPATWGFKILIMNFFDIKLILPLISILAILTCINWYSLLKIVKN